MCSSTIIPFCQRATVHKSTSKDLFVGGIWVPSGAVIGPVIVPVNRVIAQVQSPDAKRTRCGSSMLTSGKQRKVRCGLQDVLGI
jgi:hypothetical protein